MRTASRRNSSVYLVAILNLLHSKHCSKETGTKPWQDQGAEMYFMVPPSQPAPFGDGYVKYDIAHQKVRAAEFWRPACQIKG
jgi:hypothetical protein